MGTAKAHPECMSIGGATYDLFVQVNHDLCKNHEDIKAFVLPLGEKVPVENVKETCGGGACNTSVGLARLGCSAHFSGVIGDDQWGQKLLENFKKENVATDSLTVVEDEVSSFSIILSASDGERMILYTPGTNLHLDDVTFHQEKAKTMDWVYLNHIPDDSFEIEDDLVKIFEAPGAPGLTWNPGGHHLREGMNQKNTKALLTHTTLLLLNEEEALIFTKTDSIQDAMRSLKGAGVHIVCISRGKKGALATDGTNLYECPIMTGFPCIDTTGAGDAFGTGMTYGLIQGFSLQEAMKTGTINAASVVSKLGAQAGLLTDTDIQSALKTTPLDVVVKAL